MACVCYQCHQHAQTLGLAQAPQSRGSIHTAYRQAAKRWHPDHFERDPRLRPQAEERFKQIQVAYRELTVHFDRPVEQAPAVFAQPAQPAPFSFGNARGCFAAPHFPLFVQRIIANHISAEHRALGIVDLAGPEANGGGFSQFLLLTSHALILRDRTHLVSLLWYSELGEMKLVDRRKHGRLSFWQRLGGLVTGPRPDLTLKIWRRNQAPFLSLGWQAEDAVKNVLFHYLLHHKLEARR